MIGLHPVIDLSFRPRTSHVPQNGLLTMFQLIYSLDRINGEDKNVLDTPPPASRKKGAEGRRRHRLWPPFPRLQPRCAEVRHFNRSPVFIGS